MIVVIKLGTNVLTKNNKIDSGLIKNIASQIAPLSKKNIKFIIVSSGAIGLGSMQLKITKKARDIKLKQSLASIGQRILMNEYANAFAKFNIEVAQVLLTYDIISNRNTYLNLRNCINTLLNLQVIPIINENDVVSVAEIDENFGDNDKLSAIVASKIDAEKLLLLTDIDGLYTDNPRKNKSAKKINVVEKITPEIEKFAGKSGSIFAVGGMGSKIRAAKIAGAAGCNTIIANGRTKDVIKKALENSIGTLFLSSKKISSKKRWVLNAKEKGKITVNANAEKVLKKGKSSLLPVGIEIVSGNFKKGDVVTINNFAKGIIDFDKKTVQEMQNHSKKTKVVIKKENMVFVNFI